MQSLFHSGHLHYAAFKKRHRRWTRDLRSELQIVIFTEDTVSSIVYDDKPIWPVIFSDVISDGGVEGVLRHIDVKRHF